MSAIDTGSTDDMQAFRSAALPPPDPSLRAHAAAVLDAIRAHIRAAGGSIGFDEFMQQALYAPGLGYYVAGHRPFGSGGDFVTAPEVSPLYGRTLAREIGRIHAALGAADVLEIGAGSGALAEAIVGRFAAAGRPLNYRILEASPALAELQRRRLGELALPPGVRIEWLGGIGDVRIDGVVVANEVVDALPAARFAIAADGSVREIVVREAADGLALATRAAGERLSAAVRAVERDLDAPFAAGFRSELCPALGPWVADIAGLLKRGVLLFADYGCGRREYYAPERAAGTFLCHTRHRAHDDALYLPGLQDMTAWVDFTALAEAGTAAGLDLLGFTTQVRFLLSAGLTDELAEIQAAVPEQAIDYASQAKTLLLPGEMGERFRFMAFGRGMMQPPAAVAGTDLRHTL
ncbi:MAG: SAM-dependent methyltransferase [Pseudomonadota bacterium]